MTAPTPQRVQVAPLAALNEALALNDFYKNRTLALSHEAFSLREQLEATQAELAQLKQVQVAAHTSLTQDDNYGDQT